MVQTADFFVSYTSADRAWAEWIAWQLEAEGYQVSSTPGTSPPVGTGPTRCSTLPRPPSGSSPSCQPPTCARRTGRRSGGSSTLRTPAASAGCCCRSGSIGWTRRDYSPPESTWTWWGGMPAVLGPRCWPPREGRGKPTEAPEFPGDRRSEASATEAPRFPGELPPLWNVPFRPTPSSPAATCSLPSCKPGSTDPT
jgi:TIR domain